MKIGGPLKQLAQILAVAGELRPLLPTVARTVLDVIRVGVASLKDLAAALVAAEARVRELIGARKSLRTALRADLDAIRRTAHAVAVEQPGIDPETFRFPGRGDQKLLDGARAIAENVVPLQDAFVEHAMPPDFVDSLEQRIRDFDQNLACWQDASRRVGDLRMRIRSTIRDARAGARRLDPVVRNVLADDDISLAGWDKVCPGSGRRRRKPRPTERGGGTGGPVPDSVGAEPEAAEEGPSAARTAEGAESKL